jgi:hypothetical protein
LTLICALSLCCWITCSVENLADTQNKLLMRLVQLRVLEALYQHLATSCPAAAQQLPDMACPLLLSTGRAAAAPAAAAALRKPPASAKQAEGPTFTYAAAVLEARQHVHAPATGTYFSLCMSMYSRLQTTVARS